MAGKKVLIIGGGASGLMAAIAAGRSGADVTILEQMQRVGKKILATGNGRCNLTNVYAAIERYHGKNTRLINSIFEQFDVKKTISFFEELGISCREEEGGKVYPWSGQASSVLDVLRYEIQRLGIEERSETEVKRILKSKNRFSLSLKEGYEVKGDSVVLATGGKASPNLGSTGNGYKLAMDYGHKMVETFPALVQIKLNSQYLKALSGVKFIGSASIISEDRVLRKENGEILFTDYGISGPPILQLSRKVGEENTCGNKISISLDMFPEFSSEEIYELVERKFQYNPQKPLDFCFVGLLNKKLIPTILKVCGIDDIHKPAEEVNRDEKKKIAGLLKEWNFEVTGTQSWRDAQVTAGGIDVSGVNTTTLESKLVSGLYFSGEILDIDGDCGGFNLQWAWSSGYVAGINAAK